jgi:branched-chain amino acid transport system permease protein
MSFWLLLTVNSVTFGGLLFLLSAGFSLIFGLMRIPNLTHGSMFMVGAYLGSSFLSGMLGFTLNFWLAAIISAGDAWRFFHGCRSVPDGVGWRSDLGGDAGRA